MTHAKFIKELAGRLGKPQTQVRTLFKGITEAIKNILEKDSDIFIPELGTFRVKESGEKNSRNPQTKEKIVLPPKKNLRFSPAATLKREVKSVRREENE